MPDEDKTFGDSLVLDWEFHRKVKKDIYFKELDFSAQSAQSLPRHYLDFKCF